jgi:small GTP-binding protein
MDKIRIALIGSVSVGKSTMLNALFVRQFSKTKIRRTTMLPYVFREVSGTITKLQAKEINDKINKTNEEIIKITEDGNNTLTIEKCMPVYFDVPRVFDLISSSNSKLVELEIFDIPGLDDVRTKNVYFEWVTQNFYLFDIVIFVTTIENAFNKTNEMEMLQLVLENIKTHKEKYQRNIELMILVNKCDNMIYSDNKLQFIGSDEEYNEMFDQIMMILQSETKKYGISHVEAFPISAEDSYIYRTMYNTSDDNEIDLDDKYINKIGINEYGKIKWNKYIKLDFNYYKKILIDKLKTKENYLEHVKIAGYFDFRNKFNSLLEKNIERFLFGRMNYDIMSRPSLANETISKYFSLMLDQLNKEKKYNIMLKSNNNNILQIISKDIVQYIDAYIQFDTDTNLIDHINHGAELLFSTKNNNCNEYIQCINNIKNLMKVHNLNLLEEYFTQKIFQITKHLIQTHINFITNKNINHEPNDITKLISAITVDLNLSFNLLLNKPITIQELDSDLFIKLQFCVADLINIWIEKIVFRTNNPKKNDLIPDIESMIKFIEFVKNKNLSNKVLLKKFMLVILRYQLAKFRCADYDHIENNKFLIYLFTSKLFLEKSLTKYHDLLPYYVIITHAIPTIIPNNHFVNDWFDLSENKFDLPLEELYLSCC